LSVVGRLCGRDNIGFEVELDEPSWMTGMMKATIHTQHSLQPIP